VFRVSNNLMWVLNFICLWLFDDVTLEKIYYYEKAFLAKNEYLFDIDWNMRRYPFPGIHWNNYS